jgi:hypothetical protein
VEERGVNVSFSVAFKPGVSEAIRAPVLGGRQARISTANVDDTCKELRITQLSP